MWSHVICSFLIDTYEINKQIKVYYNLDDINSSSIDKTPRDFPSRLDKFGSKRERLNCILLSIYTINVKYIVK